MIIIITWSLLRYGLFLSDIAQNAIHKTQFTKRNLDHLTINIIQNPQFTIRNPHEPSSLPYLLELPFKTKTKIFKFQYTNFFGQNFF